MKEAIAMWKQRLVHLDLFIISFRGEAAGLLRARSSVHAAGGPEEAWVPAEAPEHPERALAGSHLSWSRPRRRSPHCAAVVSTVNVAVSDADSPRSSSRGLLLADSCCCVCLEND